MERVKWSDYSKYIGISVFSLVTIGLYIASSRSLHKPVAMVKPDLDNDNKDDVSKRQKHRKEKEKEVERQEKENNVVTEKEFKRELKTRRKQAKEHDLDWDESAEDGDLRKELEEQRKKFFDKRPDNPQVAKPTSLDEPRNKGKEAKPSDPDLLSEEEKSRKKERKKERKEKEKEREKKKKEKAETTIEDLVTEDDLDDTASIASSIRKEKKRHRKHSKEVEVADSKDSSRRRKRSKQEDDASSIIESDRKSLKEHSSSKSKSEDKSSKKSSGENWNADVLSGDDARKSKFLRLLGVGKNGSENSLPNEGSSSERAAEIAHVQGELERQFNAGIKMKHDGSGKRKGLGA